MTLFAFALIAAQQTLGVAYPELDPTALAPAIVQDLKRTLADPYSIRDLTICAPHHVKLKDGRPVSWAVKLGLNTKNAAGGYSGLTMYVVGFKEGRINLHAFSTASTGYAGFDRLLRNHSVNMISGCTPVPDARVQELLASPAITGR